MKNQIVSITRYLRPTVYGWVLTFTVYYTSGHSRRWWLRNNVAKLWSEDFNINSDSVSLYQCKHLPASVVRFIVSCADDDMVSFYRYSDYAVTTWG